MIPLWLWGCAGSTPTPADSDPQDTAPPTDTDTQPPTDTDPVPIEPVWEEGIRPMFEVRCAPCHFGLDFGGLSLQQPSDFIGVASSAGLPIVVSGDLEGSYLWHKVSDTQEEVGGSGERMPYEVAPLTPEERAALQEWIEAGTP